METKAALQEWEEASRALRILNWKEEFAAMALLRQTARSVHFVTELVAGPIGGVNPTCDWAPEGRCLPGLVPIKC